MSRKDRVCFSYSDEFSKVRVFDDEDCNREVSSIGNLLADLLSRIGWHSMDVLAEAIAAVNLQEGCMPGEAALCHAALMLIKDREDTAKRVAELQKKDDHS